MKIAFLINLVLCFLASDGQKKSRQLPPLPSEKEFQQKLKDERCVFKKKYSDIQLKTLFPFNQAIAVKLISFDPVEEEGRGVIHKFFHIDSARNYYLDSIKVDTNDWREIVVVDTSKLISLANLMFNYAPFKLSNYPIDVEMQCYQPRNAILFYNKLNEIFAVIEICFECEKMQFFPKSFKLNYNCTNKFDLFRRFFLQNGIKYGATQ